MKNYLCLVFLLVQFCWSVRANNSPNDETILRPCPTLDLHCIKAFILHRSYCAANPGPIPDPLYLQKYNLYLPSANITAELNDVRVQGLLNARIANFYVNVRTNRLFLSIETQNLTIDTPRLVVKYHRRTLEPLELIDRLSVIYGAVTLSMTIPFINTINMAEAEVTVFAENGNPPFSVGVNISNNSDPLIKLSFDAILANTQISVREAFVTQGPLFMRAFIQYNICDMRGTPPNYYYY